MSDVSINMGSTDSSLERALTKDEIFQMEMDAQKNYDSDWSKFYPGMPSGWTPPEISSAPQYDESGRIVANEPVGFGNEEQNPSTIPGIQPAPVSYAKAFDPSSDQISVNTGQATVQQLESLKAIQSGAPVIPQVDNTWPLLPLVFGLLILL